MAAIIVATTHSLAARKSFAVVPCCVFPEENPQRRTADGRAVVSYPLPRQALVANSLFLLCRVLCAAVIISAAYSHLSLLTDDA